MTQQSEWGAGYDAGQVGLAKAVATAELLGASRERDRIIKLLEPDYFHLIGSVGETWNGKLLMEKVHLKGCIGCEQIALIKGENK